MKLFYFQPEGHGPLSVFVIAKDAQDAATAVNLAIPDENGKVDTYAFDYPFEPEDFKVAEVGVAIFNDNS